MNVLDKAKKGIRYVFDPDYRFLFKTYHGHYHEMPDEVFLRKKYRAFMKRDLNLDQPLTYTEKLQWLKLYDRNPFYTTLVDKAAVKKVAAERLGEEHIIPTLGVWEHFDDIDFDVLPEQFVLKCTHDSGGFVVCTDKNHLNREKARAKLEASLANNYYWTGREWPYKNVPPRILAETYIPTLGRPDSIEYKVTCFGGEVGFITVCRGIAHAELYKRTNDFYNTEWNFLPFVTAYYKNSGINHEKPAELEQLIEVCEKMSAGLPVARVDCYIIDGVVVFGEITFFTWSGLIRFIPEEYDRKLGDMITLPEPYTDLPG